MTRKRETRGAPPPARSDRRRADAPKPSRPASQPAENLGRGRDRPRERRESDVVRIYGFHSVEAALRAPRRALIRLYATAAAAERLKAEIDARGVETRILSLEDISARAPRDAVHQGCFSKRGRSPRSTCPNCRRAGSSSCSTRSPIRTMSGRSCAPPPLSLSTRWSRPNAIRPSSPARSPSPPPAGSSTCRSAR